MSNPCLSHPYSTSGIYQSEKRQQNDKNYTIQPNSNEFATQATSFIGGCIISFASQRLRATKIAKTGFIIALFVKNQRLRRWFLTKSAISLGLCNKFCGTGFNPYCISLKQNLLQK